MPAKGRIVNVEYPESATPDTIKIKVTLANDGDEFGYWIWRFIDVDTGQRWAKAKVGIAAGGTFSGRVPGKMPPRDLTLRLEVDQISSWEAEEDIIDRLPRITFTIAAIAAPPPKKFPTKAAIGITAATVALGFIASLAKKKKEVKD